MSDKDNIVQFPSNEDDRDEHVCDNCTSIAIHELSHRFQSVDATSIIDRYYDLIIDSLDEDDEGEQFIHTLFDLLEEGFTMGLKQSKIRMIKELSGELMMLHADVEGQEQ